MLSREQAAFIAYVSKRLIPDLKQMGRPETADDFQTCLEIISDLSAALAEKEGTEASRCKRCHRAPAVKTRTGKVYCSSCMHSVLNGGM